MTKRIPEYLKLHTEDEADSGRRPVTEVRSLDPLCQAFADATGWQLHCRVADQTTPSAPAHWSMAIESTLQHELQLAIGAPTALENELDLPRATALAEAIGQLVQELQETRDALCRREAELAAGIPVTLHPDESQHLAEHLESVLRGGAQALDCHAAALYLLDDATSHLKLRACWGLPKTRLADPPRPLRGAVSDLEALVGHAVALENAALLPHWKSPEDYPAALCVPVSSSNTPLGTLWFFSRRTREFSDEHTHLAEIIAGRLVADLEREVIATEHLRTRHENEALHILSRFQEELAPRIPPLIDGWQVAGRTARKNTVGGDFCDWLVLPDGRLAVIAGRAEGAPVEAGLTASMLLVAFRAHATHRHNARQMLDYLNESLWTGSTGDRFAAVWYGLIDPDQGTLEFATAGTTAIGIQSEAAHRTPSAADEPELGSDPDHRYTAAHDTIQPGETLAVSTSAAGESLEWRAPARVSESTPVASPQTAEEQLDAIWRAASAEDTADGSVVVVRRIY